MNVALSKLPPQMNVALSKPPPQKRSSKRVLNVEDQAVIKCSYVVNECGSLTRYLVRAALTTLWCNFYRASSVVNEFGSL